MKTSLLISLSLFTLGSLPALANPVSCQNPQLISPNCYSATLSPATLAPALSLRVVVNSNADGTIQPDAALTLREAIQIVNGTLSLTQLSSAEQAQVQRLEPKDLNGNGSRIEFNLPIEQTTIRLIAGLPPLASPGLVVDGTTQPGYSSLPSPGDAVKLPRPRVALTPGAGVEVFRGLTVIRDRITLRGLHLYGFTARNQDTLLTPPADIFIADRWLPATANDLTTDQFLLYTNGNPANGNQPPQGTVIEDNWLGVLPGESPAQERSAFGVSIFQAQATVIRRNWIADHDGSAIITGVQAQQSQILDNVISGNGQAGMPDAIRLEGMIGQTQIKTNLICGNGGSAIYLFKPQGSIQVQDNQIQSNGRIFRRAAIYLMGNDHQVTNNRITDQPAAGIVVAAYPQSIRNQIQNNQFADIAGLSIDLNTQQNVGVQAFQQGDGPNPPRNSPNRRLETGNGAVNAPEFLSPEFFVIKDKVTLDGKAEPGTQIEIYRTTMGMIAYGSLSQQIATATTNEQGKFRVTLTNLQPGDRISAIATDPRYGTSEPAQNALVITPEGLTKPPLPAPPTASPPPRVALPCSPQLSPPPIPRPQPPETPAPEAPEPPLATPEPVRLQVPRNIHFALDKDDISPASAWILDQVAQVLTQYPALLLDLMGHIDPRNNDAYNQALGLRRATSTRNYLIAQGIAPNRITLRSYGRSQPKITGNQPLDHARNRRVEMIFKNLQGIEILFQDQETDLQLESPAP